MNIKLDVKFESFYVSDSDGNQVSDTYVHPDDGFKALRALVESQPDWETYRLFGALSVTRAHGIAENPRWTEPVALLTAYRDGPPGSKRIKYLHPQLPWLCVTVPT